MPVPLGVALRQAKEHGHDISAFTATNTNARAVSAAAAAVVHDEQAMLQTWDQEAAWAQSTQQSTQGAQGAQTAWSTEALGQDAQSQEMPPQTELAPQASPAMPDLSGISLQPSSWTSAIFDQTARELWNRLQEEGLPPDEVAEQFQNHMVAVYTQMQTQQQYEAIADSNATLTAALESMQPKDPMEKLKPLFKGDKNEPHRTALGIDPLMKYYERSKNAPYGIFIGGLRTVSNEDTLVKYFSQFGEITFVEVKRLPDRTSRGFGFLHYVDDNGVQAVLAHKDAHMIDGKLVDCKRMEPMETTKPSMKKRNRDQAAASGSSNMHDASVLSAYQSNSMYGAYGSHPY